MSRLRARVAERLVQSQSTNAILTTFNEVNMGADHGRCVSSYGEKFEKDPWRHAWASWASSLRLLVHALQKFPILNASVDGNDIVYHGFIDIGIAVGSPRGLVVPIIRNADQLSIRRN